jgi:hypothetical protein
VQLRVIPKASYFHGTDKTGKEWYLTSHTRFDLDAARTPDTFAIEVVNMSKFAVIVDEVGLLPRWSRTRLALSNPILPDAGKWPRKLEPRESVTTNFELTRLLNAEGLLSVRRAYASTVCGTTCYGSSGALRELVRRLRDASRVKQR